MVYLNRKNSIFRKAASVDNERERKTLHILLIRGGAPPMAWSYRIFMKEVLIFSFLKFIILLHLSFLTLSDN